MVLPEAVIPKQLQLAQAIRFDAAAKQRRNLLSTMTYRYAFNWRIRSSLAILAHTLHRAQHDFFPIAPTLQLSKLPPVAQTVPYVLQ